MTLKARVSVFLFVLLLQHYHAADATATLFFTPDDAFFYATLTEDQLDRWKEEKRIRLEYQMPYSERGLNGFAGFQYLEITGNHSALMANLEQMYSSLRKAIPKRLEVKISEDGLRTKKELNGFKILIYNKSFPVRGHYLGCAYNEKWFDYHKASKKSKRRPGSPYREHQPLVPTYEAAIEDWQNAKSVDPLKVKVPKDVDWWILGRPIETPVTIDADQVQVVILSDPTGAELKDYFYRIPYLRFSAVTTKAITDFQFRENSGYGDDYKFNLVKKISRTKTGNE